MVIKVSNKHTMIVIGVCVLSLMVCLGETLFNTKGEPREAVVALSMLNEGNFILPINNGVDMAYKPPLFHWLIALFSLPVGHVTEFTSRLPSAVALTAMTVAVYRFFAHRVSPKTALLVVLVMLGSFEVHRAGTNCRVDMLTTAGIVGALLGYFIWAEKRFRGIPFEAILCMSVAVLSKGPVGVILPSAVVFIYGLRMGALKELLWKLPLYALCALILPFVWYLFAYDYGGKEFLDLVYEENVLRFTGRMSYSSHENPWWYNVVTVIAGYVPYTLLIVMSIFVYRRKTPLFYPHSWRVRLKRYIKDEKGYRLYSLVSIVFIFLFYCVPSSKRSVYLLPIYPFIAYFIVEYMIVLMRSHHKVVHAFAYTLGGIAVAALALFFAIRAGVVPESIFSGKHAADNIAMLRAMGSSPISLIGCLAIVAPIAAVAVFHFFRRKGEFERMVAVTAIVLSVLFAVDGLYAPAALNYRSDKRVAERINEIQPEGKLYHYRANEEKANIVRPYTVDFYTGDRFVPFAIGRPDRCYLLSADKDMAVFGTLYPQYAVKEVEDFNHKSCDTRQMYKLYYVVNNGAGK